MYGQLNYRPIDRLYINLTYLSFILKIKASYASGSPS
jgi:hypothetical protein